MIALALATLLSVPSTGEALAAAADRFAAAHPGARLVLARDGGIEVASGQLSPALATRPEENALAFLARDGAPFGIADPASELQTLAVSAPAGAPGYVKFRRLVRGMPVFGGELTVGLGPAGEITHVAGSRALATAPSGDFHTGVDAARDAALAAVPGAPHEAVVAQGWLESAGRLVPVFRVDVVTGADSFRVYVDGATGRFLYRISRKKTAECTPGSSCPRVLAYEDSPLEQLGAPAPKQGFSPQLFDALGLPSGATVLKGTNTETFNCLGKDVNSASFPNGTASQPYCVHTANPDSNGDFTTGADLTQTKVDDKFAEQSAYHHIDAQIRFLNGLGSAAFNAAGGVGFVPGYVNLLDGKSPLDNAFFAPGANPRSGIMVYGQGTKIDVSYDAEIVYHELTHAAVDSTAQFEEFLDQFGVDTDPGAVNEGTADTFSFLNPAVGDPCLSKYFASELGLTCLRNADNRRTCRGNGPNDGSNPGRDGEVHDDGEIWEGFTWAIFDAARNQDAAGGSGTTLTDGVRKAMFAALEQETSHPSYEGYAALVEANVRSVLGNAAGDFVACTAAARDLPGCGGTSGRGVALFSGERAEGLVFGGGIAPPVPAPQQYYIDVPCGTARLHVQTGTDKGAARLYIRYGQPVQFGAPAAPFGDPQFDWVVDGNQTDLVLGPGATACPGCTPNAGSQTPFGAGRWYLLPGGADGAIFQLGASLEMSGTATAPLRDGFILGTCTWGATTDPTKPVGGRIPFTSPPPILNCTPPVTPRPPATATQRGPSAGCGCGAEGGSSLARGGLLALALLALRRAIVGGRPRHG